MAPLTYARVPFWTLALALLIPLGGCEAFYALGDIGNAMSASSASSTGGSYRVEESVDRFDNTTVYEMVGNEQVTRYRAGGSSALRSRRSSPIVESANLRLKTRGDEVVGYELKLFREGSGQVVYDDDDLELRIGDLSTRLVQVDEWQTSGAGRIIMNGGSFSDLDSYVVYAFDEDPAQAILDAPTGAYRYRMSGQRIEMSLTAQQLNNMKDFVRRYDPRAE